MIDRASGQISLQEEEILFPEMSEADFLSHFPDADQDWSHNTRSAYKLVRHYESGWSVEAGIYFEDELLSTVLLAFNDGSLAGDELSEEEEAHRSQIHSDLLHEWFGKAAPYHYDWGSVQLLMNIPYNNCQISVQYTIGGL